MYRDIYAQWPIIAQIIQWMGDNQLMIQPFAKPGAFNDPADVERFAQHQRR